MNPLNSPWRISTANSYRIVGADSATIAILNNKQHSSIVSAAPQMYFALAAMLEAFTTSDPELIEIRNLGVMALDKARGVKHD
jgi:hypothetical protein